MLESITSASRIFRLKSFSLHFVCITRQIFRVVVKWFDRRRWQWSQGLSYILMRSRGNLFGVVFPEVHRWEVASLTMTTSIVFWQRCEKDNFDWNTSIKAIYPMVNLSHQLTSTLKKWGVTSFPCRTPRWMASTKKKQKINKFMHIVCPEKKITPQACATQSFAC